MPLQVTQSQSTKSQIRNALGSKIRRRGHQTKSPNMSKQPEVLWAQRSDKVYLTVSLPDANEVSVECQPEGFFKFSVVDVNGESFNYTLQLYGNISPQGCKTKNGLRNIMCEIQKEQKGWWKRLLKSEADPPQYIKVDWNKWCDEEDENLELTSAIIKKRKIDELSPSHLIPKARENQPGRCLVICCSTVLEPSHHVSYTFESIPIEKLILHCSKRMPLEPIKELLFEWRVKGESSESDTCDLRFYSMSFLHAGDSIYVGGGTEPRRRYVDHYRDDFFPYPKALPSEFHCISLSGDVMSKSPMLGEKYLPLMTEIDGLIYVLSKPPPRYAARLLSSPFEVYYPMEDRWEKLPPPPPPFIEVLEYEITYGYFGVDKKLYVSTPHYASCYDIVHRIWLACDFFSGTRHYFKYGYMTDLPWPDGCGHPFPFKNKAIHFKSNIFLCILMDRPYVGAFRIVDGEKVERVPFRINKMSYGVICQLVDLGDDYFAAFMLPDDTKYNDEKK